MLSLSASYQTGLQLLASANGSSSANASETTTDAGKTSSGSASQNKSASTNSADGYSSASTIAALKAVATTASGAEAGVMAAIVNSLSSKSNDVYGNDCEAGNAAAKANASLSSQQISDTLLSGGALVQGINSTAGGGMAFDTLSLKDITDGLLSAANGIQAYAGQMSQWLQEGMPSSNKQFGNTAYQSMSIDKIQQTIAYEEANAANLKNKYNGLSNAIANGTVTVQRATDVKGLEYVDAPAQYTESPGGSGSTLSWGNGGGSYDSAYVQKHSDDGYLTAINGIGLYFSW